MLPFPKSVFTFDQFALVSLQKSKDKEEEGLTRKLLATDVLIKFDNKV